MTTTTTLTREQIADWIKTKDDCCAFADIARAVRLGDDTEARMLAARYRSWLSAYEIEWFTKFGLL